MEWLSSESYWHATSDSPPVYPQLREDVQADVVIIGAGITGLTAALHLKQAGRRVVVVEAGRVGAGTTGGTSGHLDALPDQGLERLIRDHGKENARIVTQARMAAIDQIEQWCRELAVDCDFRRVPAYEYSESSKGAKSLFEQCHLARTLGLTADAVEELDLPFDTAGALRIEHQARFHSLRYIRALAAHVNGDGCAVYEHTRAHPPEDGDPCMVETDGAKVEASRVLLCTHSAFLGISELDLRAAPYQSYVMTASVSEDFPDGLYWDDSTPYHYLRRAGSQDPRTVIIGGADHKTGQGGDESDSFRRLEEYARQHLNVQSINHRWSAEFFEPADGLPYVGRVPFATNLFVGTGFSGTGLTFGTAAGKLLADLVLNYESELAGVLSPSRFKPLAEAGGLISENVNAAKHFVADRFGPKSIESLAEIPTGSGQLVRYNGDALAAFREGSGKLHLLSPVCTHAGCYVQWNEAESTWDCPCHGGRYAPTGERLYGPPAHDLKPKVE